METQLLHPMGMGKLRHWGAVGTVAFGRAGCELHPFPRRAGTPAQAGPMLPGAVAARPPPVPRPSPARPLPSGRQRPAPGVHRGASDLYIALKAPGRTAGSCPRCPAPLTEVSVPPPGPAPGVPLPQPRPGPLLCWGGSLRHRRFAGGAVPGAAARPVAPAGNGVGGHCRDAGGIVAGGFAWVLEALQGMLGGLHGVLELLHGCWGHCVGCWGHWCWGVCMGAGTIAGYTGGLAWDVAGACRGAAAIVGVLGGMQGCWRSPYLSLGPQGGS